MSRTSFVPKENRPALAVAAAALFISLGSVGHAAVTQLIGGSQIYDGSVTGTDIKNGSLTGADIRDGEIKGVDIRDGYLTGLDLQNGSIPGTKLKPGSLTVGVFPETARPALKSDVYTKAQSDQRHPVLGAAQGAETSRMVVLRHTTTLENVLDSRTCIDDPALNGNPGALVTATHTAGLRSHMTALLPTNVALMYDDFQLSETQGKWCLMTEDLSPFPVGMIFNVVGFGQTPLN